MKTYTFMEGVEQDWMQMDGDNYSYECVGRDFYLATEVEAHIAALQAQHAEAIGRLETELVRIRRMAAEDIERHIKWP